MVPLDLPLTMQRGADFDYDFDFRNPDGTAITLTTASLVIADSWGAGIPLVAKTHADAEVTLNGTAAVEVRLTATDTDALPAAGGRGVYHLEVTHAEGTDVPFRGEVEFLPQAGS